MALMGRVRDLVEALARPVPTLKCRGSGVEEVQVHAHHVAHVDENPIWAPGLYRRCPRTAHAAVLQVLVEKW